jgi:hypothetical protein
LYRDGPDGAFSTGGLGGIGSIAAGPAVNAGGEGGTNVCTGREGIVDWDAASGGVGLYDSILIAWGRVAAGATGWEGITGGVGVQLDVGNTIGCLTRLGGGGDGFSIRRNSAEPSEERLIRLFVETETSTSEPSDSDKALTVVDVIAVRDGMLTGEVSDVVFGASQSAFRRFVPSTISSHTAVTYLAVAPFFTRVSGENPSCRRLRIMSM